ncbi:MAG TPA: HAD-IB family phosphatase [Polyangia bacterium]|nr:HAD-IB family phosphatase [Polyangia bacterium]
MQEAPAAVYEQTMPPVLVLDFDGTLTDVDVGDAVCDRFAPPAWREIDKRWERREISLPEAQRGMWGLVRATREQALAGAREVGHLRPGLESLLGKAEGLGAEVWLASGGFDFYIEALLGEQRGRFARAYYNATRFEGDQLTVEFPHAALACSSCAVCKGKVCDLARERGGPIVFVGDGHSDRCVIGRADRIAAVRGSHLARWCREHGVAVLEFDRLDEVEALLE